MPQAAYSDSLRHKEGERWLNYQGYVNTRYRGHVLPEHRVVMERILGRPLKRGIESVHHVDGNRENNSPENLELWVGGIRYGQRAKDIRCSSCGASYV